MRRRTFLQLVAAAPLAAAGVKLTSTALHAGIDYGAGEASSVVSTWAYVGDGSARRLLWYDELAPGLDAWQVQYLVFRAQQLEEIRGSFAVAFDRYQSGTGSGNGELEAPRAGTVRPFPRGTRWTPDAEGPPRETRQARIKSRAK